MQFASRSCLGFWLIGPIFFSANLQTHADDDENAARVPVVGRPTSDFYNAAGTGVTLTATANPAELSTDEWLTFTLTIEKLTNAPEVEKPSLKALEDFATFQVDESLDLDPKINPDAIDRRAFIYKLRPASPKVTLIPEIAFHYFDPKRRTAPNRPGDRFPKAFSNAVSIRVTPAKPKSIIIAPLEVPPFADSIATDDSVLSRTFSSSVPDWVWMLAVVLPPLLAVGWVIAWRSLYPDAVKLMRIKKNKAVRKALSALAAMRRKPSDDVAGSIAGMLIHYLRERFELPELARTPGEIAAHFHSMNWPTDRIDRTNAFFRTCDAARFSPAHFAVLDLADEAEQIIIALEAAA